ncbi:CLUMA_CG000931, isoform A [Clunio marinus]|uniref:CLUMA_CG000931, isoform A n=1 Tax=Clunio marinus TaxID=568069 RepID=A0A1J1HLG7_9DIPT|nr:CLUMA_CG000931, isoform A [Clunio marinus]
MKVKKSFLFLFFTVSVVSSNHEKCFNICPDIISFDPITPIQQIAIDNLRRNGPSDGVCISGDKWIIDGTQFDLPSKCVCLDIPQGENISPENGPKCPDHLKASIEETIEENSIRNYELIGGIAPEDGWCPEGKIKWIMMKSQVNIPRDICVCIDGYEWFSPEIECIESD